MKNNLDHLNDVTIKSYVGHSDDVTCCTFSSDWLLLATGGNDLTLRIWEMKKNKLLFTLVGHTSAVKCVSFSPDNKKVASGSSDGTILVWDPLNGVKLNRLTGHLLSVESVSFSHSGQLLCTGSWDHTAILWNLSSSSPLRVLDEHKSVVQCCNFSDDGELLATGSWDYTIHVYKIKEIISSCEERTPSLIEFCKSKQTSANVVNMKKQRPSTASCANENIFKEQKQRPKSSCNPHKVTKEPRLDVKILKRHTSNIKHLCFSSNHLLASASWDCTVCIWDPLNTVCLHQCFGHDGFVQSCAFSSDNLYLASASDDETVKIWSIKDGSLVKTLEAYTEEIHQLSFTTDGTLLTSGPESLSLCLY